MRAVIHLTLTAGLVLATGTAALRAQAGGPAWAYAITPPAPAGAAAAPAEPAGHDTTPRSVPGTRRTFTLAQIEDTSSPADWFPEDHPPMPEIVAHGRKPAVRACAYCHYPNGQGRMSNAPVSGLPVDYFVQTLMDFKNGVRKTAEPKKGNTAQMAAFAKAMTAEEMRAAAEYFAAVPNRPWIRTVETRTVPKMKAEGSIYFPLPGTGTEPLGARIVETPEQPEQAEPLRNPRSGFVAYVPVGSIRRGESLVKTGGGGRTVACGVCHGTDLKGLGPVPRLAGRSPSYMVRQMYDIQMGARHGVWSDLMKPVVAKLSNDDYVAIGAYLASLAP